MALLDINQPQTDATSSVELLFPPFRRALSAALLIAHSKGLDVYPFETYRSPERQAMLYGQGRTQSGPIITDAKPWESFHQFGLAVDLVFGGPGKWTWNGNYQALGKIFEEQGFSWAGRWRHPESPHFEMTYDMTIGQAKVIANRNGILGVWSYLMGRQGVA